GEHSVPPRFGVNFPDGRSSGFRRNAILSGVAVRTNGHEQMTPIGTRDDILRPMMIDRTSRQIGNFNTGFRDAALAISIREPQERIRIRDKKILPNQSHAEWRVQILKKDRSRHTARMIAEQSDAIGARRGGPGTPHNKTHRPTPDPFAILG